MQLFLMKRRRGGRAHLKLGQAKGPNAWKALLRQAEIMKTEGGKVRGGGDKPLYLLYGLYSDSVHVSYMQ
jgi:hypothetical protein